MYNMKQKILSHFLFTVTFFLLTIAWNLPSPSPEAYVTDHEDELETLSRLDETDVTEDTAWIVETGQSRVLSPLQLCGLESIARNNPDHTVILGFIVRSIYKSERLKKVLEQHDNIKLRLIDLDSLFSPDSSLHDLWRGGAVNGSQWPVSHLSDLVRYELLWRHGGTWLDTDILATRHLPNRTNFVSVELSNKAHLAAGATRFTRHHPVVGRILEQLRTEFSGAEWGANGPVMLTRVMREQCGDIDWSGDTEHETVCGDVTVFKQRHFYPINWRQWFWMFKVTTCWQVS